MKIFTKLLMLTQHNQKHKSSFFKKLHSYRHDCPKWYQDRTSYHILVDEVEHHVGETRVTPVAVDKQQLPEVFKPGDGKVTGHHRLGNGTRGHEHHILVLIVIKKENKSLDADMITDF